MTSIVISTKAAIRGKLPLHDKTHRIASWSVLSEADRECVMFIDFEAKRHTGTKWGFEPRSRPFIVSFNYTLITSAKTLEGAIAAAHRRFVQREQ